MVSICAGCVMSSLLVAPLEALTDSALSDPERRVLLALFSFRGKDTGVIWPSADEIAKRANINDKTWISKLTKGLVEKGWVEKKKRGFTGGNEYKLRFPERLNGVDSESNLGSKSKLVADTKPNLGSQSKSKLDPEPKCKEQTIEQTNEQTKKNIKKRAKVSLDYSAWGDVDPLTFSDWIALRKVKRAAVSQTVINAFAVEFEKAGRFGYSASDCLRFAVVSNWAGFKFEWMQSKVAPLPPSLPPRGDPAVGLVGPRSTRNRSLIEDLGDRSWAK